MMRMTEMDRNSLWLITTHKWPIMIKLWVWKLRIIQMYFLMIYFEGLHLTQTPLIYLSLSNERGRYEKLVLSNFFSALISMGTIHFFYWARHNCFIVRGNNFKVIDIPLMVAEIEAWDKRAFSRFEKINLLTASFSF